MSPRLEARLFLMTEVWECLAAESPESAHAAASFCIRALEHITSAACNGEGVQDLSWILEESSACWSDYLVLIDPFSTEGQAEDGERASDGEPDTRWEISEETPPPVIDATTLFQMLTGAILPERTSEAGRPPPESRAETHPRPSLSKAGETAELSRTVFPIVPPSDPEPDFPPAQVSAGVLEIDAGIP